MATRDQLLGAMAGPRRKVFTPNMQRGGNKQFNTGAGAKAYGGGRPAPNMGATGAQGKIGYAKRDAMRKALARRG